VARNLPLLSGRHRPNLRRRYLAAQKTRDGRVLCGANLVGEDFRLMRSAEQSAKKSTLVSTIL